MIIKALSHVKRIFSFFYNKYYSKYFATCGSNLHLECPINILGKDVIFIGNNFVARKNLKIRAFTSFNSQIFDPKIIIGENVNIETDCHIGCINQVVIGDNVLIASGVFISDHFHGKLDYSDIHEAPIARTLSSKGPVIIEDNVWVGERAVILSGVTIGRFSVIGANAVVTRSIPPYSVAVGVPAVVIKSILNPNDILGSNSSV